MTLARLFIFFGGLLVLALFTALIAPPFIDWTNYREDFEREATRILGKEVVVHGTADARLLPFPSVTFNDVEVGPREGAPAMMHIAHFTMDAELAPFLSGEIRIFDMMIERPEIRLALDEHGRFDWTHRPRADLPGETVVLERVEIVDGTLIVADRQNGRTHTLENIQSVLSADSLAGPWHVQGTASMAGRSGAFSLATGALAEDGTIRLNTRILPDGRPVSLELQGSASIEEGKPRYHGNFTVQVLDIAARESTDDNSAQPKPQPALRGTGLFTATSQRLRIDEYRLEIGATADPYVVEGEATLDAGRRPEFLVIANGQQIDVDRFARGEDPQERTTQPQEGEEPEPLSAVQRLAAFRQLAEAIPIPDLPGRVSLSLPAVIAGETTLREVTLEARPRGTHWQIDSFAAALPGRTRLEAEGTLRLADDFGFAGNMLLASNQPSGFAAWLTDEVHPAIRGLSDAGFEADVELTEHVQRFEKLELIVGDDRLRGSVSRTRRDGHASLALDLTGDRFDLDALRALAGLFTDGTNNSLSGYDIAAHLKVEEFAAFGIGMAGVATRFTVRDGLVDIDNLSIADVAGATVEAEGVFSDLAAAPQGSGRLSLRSDNPRRLLGLAERHLGPHVGGADLSERAGLLADTKLEAELKLGSARDTVTAATGGYGLTVQGETGGTRLSVEVTSDTSILRAFQGPLTLDLQARNERARQLLAQLGLPVLPFETGSPLSLSASLDGSLSKGATVDIELVNEDSQLTAKGDLSVSEAAVKNARLDVALNSDDLEPYLLLGGIGLPGFGSGLPVDLGLTVSATPGQWSLDDMAGHVAGNALSGRLAIDRGRDPTLSGSLSMDEIYLEWLAEGLYGQPLRNAEGGWSRADFAAWNGLPFSIDIALEAGRAYLGFAEAAREVTAKLSFEAGKLRIADTMARWLGGTLHGDLVLANIEQTGTVEARMELTGANVARALTPVGGEAPASGNADLSISLEGTGKSARAMIGALTGSGALHLSGLAIEGFEDDAMPAILAAADMEKFEISVGTVRPIARAAILAGGLRVDDVSVPITVAAGAARASNIVLKADRAELRGDVRLDLADADLTARFQATFDAGKESLPGATPALDLTLAGPVSNPDLSINATEMSNFLSLRAYERERRRVERVQAAVLEKQRLRREAAFVRDLMEQRRRERLDEEAARRRERAWRAAVERARQARQSFQPPQNAVPLPVEPPKQPTQAEAAAGPAPSREELTVAPSEDVERRPLPPPTWEQPTQPSPPAQLDFDALPGVDIFN